MKSISINFMTEKREGHGEDSAPFFLSTDDFCAVGVFDGMGGSGAAMCKSDLGEHTKAYVASRIVKEAVESYIRHKADESTTNTIDAEGIRLIAKSRLEQEKSNFPAKASGLRSRLVRDYPTTLALITSQITDEGSLVNSYWAGDSRNFLWTQDGFFQISKDDLDTELDPLENLRNDAALSNCVCADRDFIINQKAITVQGKYILISATDGCFGYFLTPMHFQNVLLAGLKNSSDEAGWCSYVKDAFAKVTGDDVSLSLCAIGYESFDELKASFEKTEIPELTEINKIQDEISRISIDLEEKKNSLEGFIQEGWSAYKESYLKYLNEPAEPEEISTQDENKSPEKDELSGTNIEETTKDDIGTDASSTETEVLETTHIVSEEEKSEKTSEELKSSETLLVADSPDKEVERDTTSEEKTEATLPVNEEKRDFDSEKVSATSKEIKTEAVDHHIKDSLKSLYEGEVGLRGKSYGDYRKKDDAPETDPRIFSFNTIEEAVDNFRQALKDIKAPSQFIDLFDSFFNKKR